jgi:hypothetical protein
VEVNMSVVAMKANSRPAEIDRVEVVEVTPAQAQAWLDNNHPRQRKVGQQHVLKLADDMDSGAWTINGQAILIDRSGRLVDGQHRLHALILSGAPVRMLVMWGAFDFDTIDQGRARSVATVLGVSHKDVAIATALRMAEAGRGTPPKMSPAMVLETLAHFRSDTDAVMAVTACRLPSGVIAGLVYAYPCNPDAILELAGQIISGEMLKRGDPAFAMRSWLASRGPGPATAGYLYAACSVARYCIEGKTITHVQPSPFGYRVITGRRRALKIPHTPTTDMVSLE